MSTKELSGWRLYVITDERLSGKTHAEVARAAIDGGADVIQLRDKQACSRVLWEAGLEIRRLTREAGIPFIVNDRVDIALAVEADGVHVGQEDLPVSTARDLLGEEKIIGCSAGNLEEALQGAGDGADYLGIGPIYEARSTKADAGSPRGLDLIRTIKMQVSLPLVAIGGITHDNARAVRNAGAECVAVISAVVSAGDIRESCRRLKRIVSG